MKKHLFNHASLLLATIFTILITFYGRDAMNPAESTLWRLFSIVVLILSMLTLARALTTGHHADKEK